MELKILIKLKIISKFSDAVVIGSTIVNQIKDLKKQNLNDDDIVESLINFILNLSSGLNN